MLVAQPPTVHAMRTFWDRGTEAVPVTTCASDLLDGQDLREHAQAFGFTLPMGRVLDVGCGTGRLAAFCRDYQGVDIAPSAVAYCRARGIEAGLISGPFDLPAVHYDAILCLSVFTHIDAELRWEYLRAFASRAERLLFDVLPGDGTGSIDHWTAHLPTLGEQVDSAGWTAKAYRERISPQGVRHRYFWCERAKREETE